MSDQNKDYSTGEPRHHHEFYIEDGNIAIQVQNAIFKVHHYHLAQRSSVLNEIFRTPQYQGCQDGTDAKPLVLSGDTAVGWEALLGSIYGTKNFRPDNLMTDVQLIVLLRVAHKYCMESIEAELLSHFQICKDKTSFFKLLDAARIVGSETLEKKAIGVLIPFKLSLTVGEAIRLGTEAFYEIIMSSNQNTTSSDKICTCGRSLSTYCFPCTKWHRVIRS